MHGAPRHPADVVLPRLDEDAARQLPGELAGHHDPPFVEVGVPVGRLPPPGRFAIKVTSCRSSWMTRRDHGGGPILATRSATRVRSVLGPSALAARGGVGPVAK